MEPHEVIAKAYEARKRKNSAYSKRAFARDLGTSIGRVSELLSGKTGMGLTLGLRIARALKLEDKEFDSFIEQIQKSQSKLFESKYALDEKCFSIIQDPIHFHILALFLTRDFELNETWIANRLGTKPNDILAALDRLSSCGIIEYTPEKGLRLNYKALTTTHDVPSASLRLSHKVSIHRAIDALDSVPTELRDITSIIMPTNLKNLKEAKTLIRNFRKRMERLLETGPKDEVYELNIQLIPVTKAR